VKISLKMTGKLTRRWYVVYIYIYIYKQLGVNDVLFIC
jgi:hypothetical protein